MKMFKNFTADHFWQIWSSPLYKTYVEMKIWKYLCWEYPENMWKMKIQGNNNTCWLIPLKKYLGKWRFWNISCEIRKNEHVHEFHCWSFLTMLIKSPIKHELRYRNIVVQNCKKILEKNENVEKPKNVDQIP